MKFILTLSVIYIGLCSIQQSQAQTMVLGSDVGVSMGLMPIYEITQIAGCPQIQAAPSFRVFDYAYRTCSDLEFVRYEKNNDNTEERFNRKLRELCSKNELLGNGCKVEIRVDDVNDFRNTATIIQNEQFED
jgi:hypothetical protein